MSGEHLKITGPEPQTIEEQMADIYSELVDHGAAIGDIRDRLAKIERSVELIYGATKSHGLRFGKLSGRIDQVLSILMPGMDNDPEV